MEEEGREVPYGQEPALLLDFQLKTEAQGKDELFSTCQEGLQTQQKLSCRKTVQDSHLRPPH